MCQLKYNCKPYPIINTGGFSKVPPGGVDESDELDYQQPRVG